MDTEKRTADDVALTEVEKSEDRRLRRTVLTVVVVLLATAASVWLAFKVRNLLFMVFVSVFVAVAMEPPVYFLAKRGWKRGPRLVTRHGTVHAVERAHAFTCRGAQLLAAIRTHVN
jgi:hypothetical protein